MAKGNKPKNSKVNAKKVKAKKARAKRAKARKAKDKKPKPRTPTFHRFLDLPTELRLKVWEQALLEARPGRRIILYQLRVVPLKQSVSPLLLVNHESRTCAKAFYNVKLDVYAVPDLSDVQIKALDKKNHWAQIPGIERAVEGKIHGYTDTWTRRDFEIERERLYTRHDQNAMFGYCWGGPPEPFEKEKKLLDIYRREARYTVDLEEHWADYVGEQLRVLGPESAIIAEKSGSTRGAFYISPEHDVFIGGYECGRHFHIKNASKVFGAELGDGLACHHITGILDASTRKKSPSLCW